MKSLVNSASSLILGIAMLVAAPLAVCGQEADLRDELRMEMAAVNAQIARDLSSQLDAARSVPHPARERRAPSVEIVDIGGDAAADMYVVVVEASRLPALESVAAHAAIASTVRF